MEVMTPSGTFGVEVKPEVQAKNYLFFAAGSGDNACFVYD